MSAQTNSVAAKTWSLFTTRPLAVERTIKRCPAGTAMPPTGGRKRLGTSGITSNSAMSVLRCARQLTKPDGISILVPAGNGSGRGGTTAPAASRPPARATPHTSERHPRQHAGRLRLRAKYQYPPATHRRHQPHPMSQQSRRVLEWPL